MAVTWFTKSMSGTTTTDRRHAGRKGPTMAATATATTRTTRSVEFHGWTLPAGSAVELVRWSAFELATATAFDTVSATVVEPGLHGTGRRVALPTSAVPVGSFFPEAAA